MRQLLSAGLVAMLCLGVGGARALAQDAVTDTAKKAGEATKEGAKKTGEAIKDVFTDKDRDSDKDGK